MTKMDLANIIGKIRCSLIMLEEIYCNNYVKLSDMDKFQEDIDMNIGDILLQISGDIY